MAQQLLFAPGDFLDDDDVLRGELAAEHDEPSYHACFAGLIVVPPEGYTFLVRLELEFEESVVKSHLFTRRVNHWIKLGLHLGLKQFEGVRWRVFKHDIHGMFFVFYFPTTVILQQNCNHRKLYHLHLFFFRFLWEQYDVPERTREIWGQLRNKIPHFNRLAAFWLAEKASYLEKKKTYGKSDSYGTYGHHLLRYRKSGAARHICAPGGHDLWVHFMKTPHMKSFDTEFFGENYEAGSPAGEDLPVDWFASHITNKLEKQSLYFNKMITNINEVLRNEQKKTAGI